MLVQLQLIVKATNLGGYRPRCRRDKNHRQQNPYEFEVRESSEGHANHGSLSVESNSSRCNSYAESSIRKVLERRVGWKMHFGPNY